MSRRNVTNKMVARAALAEGHTYDTVTGGDLDYVYETLREAAGNPTADAATNARTVVSALGDDRWDKIGNLMEQAQKQPKVGS